MKVKGESEKAGLKLNIQKTKIMASGPITSWETDGETMETVKDFIFLGSKITADDDCSREIKTSTRLDNNSLDNNFLIPYTKVNLKWTKDQTTIPETTKLLEVNIGRTLFDINCRNNFWVYP